ncbi:MAG TPA: hypothetical protein PLE19_04960 [Planctomycetota bacterium]|nr:hypothetical protein [Planctomycetota bacterium]HRR82133.1 hypothetical protein [Planctomycetota bacterium]HRT95468.1 hypothetical protein [Planctomycetota bacterium]
MWRIAFAVSLVLAASLASSAADEAPASPRSEARRPWPPAAYAAERVNDLLDAFELNAGIGRGAKLSLRYGLHFFGLGEARTRRYGVLDRRMGTWRELDSELSLFPLSLLAWPVEGAAGLAGARQLQQDARFVLQAGTEGVQHLDRKKLNGDPEFVLKDTVEGPLHTRWGDCFPIGAEMQAGVGLRLTVRPLQLVDFLAGFIGIELDPWLATERER